MQGDEKWSQFLDGMREKYDYTPTPIDQQWAEHRAALRQKMAQQQLEAALLQGGGAGFAPQGM